MGKLGWGIRFSDKIANTAFLTGKGDFHKNKA
jgi:hypothetical protein